MALFSDGPPATIDLLAQHDSFVLSVATTEGINLSNKLQLAYTDLGVDIANIFAREASIYAPVLGEAPLDLNHLANTPVTITWHAFKTLELIYRDAYFSQLNDRYKAKWAEYQALSQNSRLNFVEAGAALVIDPLVQPGLPVTSFETSSQSGGSVYVTLTFVNAESEESSPAAIAQIVVPDGNILIVGSPPWPSNAVNWNLYGGINPDLLVLQNPVPIPLGAVWQYTLPGAAIGKTVGGGQSQNVTRDLPRRIMRG